MPIEYEKAQELLKKGSGRKSAPKKAAAKKKAAKKKKMGIMNQNQRKQLEELE